MFQLKSALLTFILISISLPAWSQQGGGGYLSQKAAARENKRWTLQEWLEQRDRNRMMDLWLSMNSPSPFEGMIGAAYKSYLNDVDKPKSEKNYTSSEGYLTAHAKIVGLTAEYENNLQENYNDLSGMLNLRVFGDSIQSTFLTLHYGQRTRTLTSATPATVYKNQFAQISLQLYLMKYFGLDGSYRNYLPMTDDSLKQEVKGSLTEGGIFIDFKAVRVFGSWYQDVQVIRSTVSPFDETTTKRTGTKAGLKLFF